ncbi:hypothetical protein NTG1052_50039 [Candidatus Nitrotoga sp. 1052]|nr:hypothetical protein NTG1052_50039 [Candidatus Nitrotoga sp. 1052]
MKQGHSFTRKDIVLSAANQDGGAHDQKFGQPIAVSGCGGKMPTARTDTPLGSG